MSDKILPRRTRRSLPMALLRAREVVMEEFRPMLARHDVTEQQWRVVRVLAEAGQLDASEVALRAAILAPSLTRIIRNLEERKLIRRKKDAADGRRVILEIAPGGAALIRRAHPESVAAYERLDARFGAQRISALLDLLDEFTADKS
jgi:homoprotocatechuate degradation regulator HpaR